MKKYAAILYDLDGTLLNTIDMNILPLMKIVEEETGEKKTFDELKHFFGQPGMEVMQSMGFQNPEKVYARWVSYVNQYPDGAQIYEPLADILADFHASKIRQAVVSSKKRAQYAIDFVRHGYDRYIDFAVLEEDTRRHKPYPDPLLLALDKLQMSPHEVLYLGDSAFDYEACQRAGVDFAYARWGSVSDEGIGEASYLLEKPEDLWQLKTHLKRKQD